MVTYLVSLSSWPTHYRQDCPTSPFTDTKDGVPASTLDHQGLMEFFAKEFNFSPDEVVALMGELCT
jgi:hypothetical protein